MDVQAGDAEDSQLEGDGGPGRGVPTTSPPRQRGRGSARRWRPDLAAWPPARRNRWLLAGVAVGFGLFELLTVGLRYPYSTDEAIYLSQLNPDVPAYEWDAWRAWGMPVLGAPVALLDAPLSVVRLYFVILASVGLFLAFRPWLTVSGRPLAPLAAGIFGSTAVVVHNGSLALPNLYSGLAAVAATGYFVACRREGDGLRRSAVGLAVAVALAALVRPSDSLWLVMPLGLTWLGLSAWRRPAVGGAIVAGQVVGWGPWIIESFLRFGGPVNRLHVSSEMLGGTHLYPDLAMVQLYVKLWNAGWMGAVSLDVPVRLRGGSATVSTVHLAPIDLVDVLWWLAVAGAMVVGLVGAWRAGDREGRAPFVLPLAVGLSTAFSYLFMMRYGQLRFLLPALGLLVLPVAYGVLRLSALRGLRPRLLGPGLAVPLVLGLTGVQLSTALSNSGTVSRSDASYSALIDRLRELGVSQRCAIAGDGRFNVAYQLGCEALGSRPGIEEPERIRSAREQGKPVALVLRRPPEPGTFLDHWRPVEVEVAGQAGSWHVYLPPD